MHTALRVVCTRRLVGFVTIAAMAGAMFIAISPAADAHPTCSVENERTGAQGADLQQAIDDANNKDTIDVMGVCFGSFFVVDKEVTLRGVPTAVRKKATLDGANGGPVLIVESATLRVKDLLITHGSSQLGGGIFVNLATVILNGSTRVEHNSAGSGGGIGQLGGSLTLNGSARVTLNAAGDGGGVWTLSGTITMNKTSRVNKNDASGVGGGIYVGGSILTMNGSTTIIGNTAGTDGGGVFNDASSLNGAVAGGNVRNNDPNDIAP